MRLWTEDGKTYRLYADTPMDLQFLGTLNQDGQALRCVELTRFKPDGAKHWEIDGCILQVDPQHPDSVRATAARQALSALGQLVRLGLREAAQDGHVGTAPANPQAQEQPTTSLVELQSVLHALRDMVVEHKLVPQEVVRTHGSPSSKLAEEGILPCKG